MIGDSRKRYDWSAIQSVYDSGKSTRELASIFGITLGALHSARKRGDLVTRSHADSVRLLLKQGKVDRFSQWTPERRKQQSDRKKKLFSEHPEKHPNRILANNRVNMSYPERLVFDWLKSQNIDFEHNRRIDRYYVDFCVGSLVIEVDGKAFHDPIYDANRDTIISSYGFVVRRFPAKLILVKGPSIVLDDSVDVTNMMAAIIDIRKKYICKFCSTEHFVKRKYCSDACKSASRKLYIKQSTTRVKSTKEPYVRPTVRPSYDELTAVIASNMSFILIGKKYGVSDNAVRKWCKIYNIDTKKRNPIDDMKFTEMVNTGCGVSEISKVFGVTIDRIHNHADKLGLVIVDKTCTPISADVVDKAKELIGSGLRNADIIPLVGLDQKQISAIRCKYFK